MPKAKRFPRPTPVEPAWPPPGVEGNTPLTKKVRVDQEQAIAIMERKGVWGEHNVECLCVVVLPDAAPQGTDAIDAYEKVPGKCHKVDASFNGYPVFRQEATEGGRPQYGGALHVPLPYQRAPGLVHRP